MAPPSPKYSIVLLCHRRGIKLKPWKCKIYYNGSNDTDICHILFFMCRWHTPNSKWFYFTRFNESHKRWNSLTILLAFLQLFHTRKLFSESKINHIVLTTNRYSLIDLRLFLIFSNYFLFKLQISHIKLLI